MVGKLLDNRLSVVNAALSTNSTYKKTPSDHFKNELQSKINEEFQYASDVYTIQEELVIGSNTLTDVDVRITHVLSDKGTGEKLGDDWRNIIFKDMNHAYGLGHIYSFNDYYWLTVNTDRYKYVTASCTIRRCNYTLKWLNDVGGIEQAPCIVDYYKFTTGNNVDESNYIRVGEKIRYITLQKNDVTYKILRDRRFILDRIAYRIIATDSITKSGLYMLTAEEHQFNSAQDLLYPDGTGIANYYGNSEYTIELSPSSLSLAVGNSITLSWIVKYGGVVVTDKMVNIEPNGNFITISDIQNNSCTVAAIDEGAGSIRVSLEGNDSVYADIDYEVTSSPSQVISEVLEGSDSITNGEFGSYSIYKKIDNVIQSDTYTFELVGSGAMLNIVDGNNCSIQANAENTTITLKAINNNTNNIIIKIITLIGLW